MKASSMRRRIGSMAARIAEEREDDLVVEAEEDSSQTAAEDSEDGDGECEFSFVNTDSELSSPISADEIFLNGQIRPVYPFFSLNVFQNGKEKDPDSDSVTGPKIRLPLRKLFIQERETTLTTSSSSSEEEDELEGLPADMYCVWRPKTAEERCNKSSSTGSISKRWKLKDFLPRSHSDGKDSFIFPNSGDSGRKKIS